MFPVTFGCRSRERSFVLLTLNDHYFFHERGGRRPGARQVIGLGKTLIEGTQERD